MCPVEPRRKRSAPWAAQPKVEKRRLLAQFRATPVPPKFAEVAKLDQNVANLSRQDQINFVKNNRESVKAAMIATLTEVARKPQAADYRRINDAVKSPEGQPDENLGIMFSLGLHRVFREQNGIYYAGLERHFGKYLKERKIPIDKHALITTLNSFVEQPVFKANIGIQPAAFEQKYISELKKFRHTDLAFNRMVKRVNQEVFRGKRLTPGQRITVRRWFARNLDRLAMNTIMPKETAPLWRNSWEE